MAIKPTISIFTGTENFGLVYKEQNQINTKFIEGTLPFTSTSGNYAVNMKGKTRIISLQGAHDGTGFTGGPGEQGIKNFIADMEHWIQGTSETLNIQAHITYTDSFEHEYEVYCVDFSWFRSFSDPNRIIYNLLLKQA